MPRNTKDARCIMFAALLVVIGPAVVAPRVLRTQDVPIAAATDQRPPSLIRTAPCDGPAPVCALLLKFLTAFNARDFDAFRQTFADDISFFVDRPFPPRRLDGRAAAESVFAGGFAPYGASATGPKPPLPAPLVPSHLRVQAYGDLAIITFELKRPTEFARRTLVARREGSD